MDEMSFGDGNSVRVVIEGADAASRTAVSTGQTFVDELVCAAARRAER